MEQYLPFTIHDDLVPLGLQDKLHYTIFSRYESYHLPLHYRSNITGNKESLGKSEEQGFGTQIYGVDNSFIERRVTAHKHSGLLLSPLYSITEKLNITIWEILNARVFMMLAKGNKSITTYPHVDLNFPHIVCLYYVNDTDGDTVFYEGDKEINRVTPKKGRCVIFDGRIYHASSTPTLNDRAIINYNFTPMRDNPKLSTQHQ